MPIQCSITQTNGSIATYHIIAKVDAEFDFAPPLARTVLASYADKAHYESASPSITSLSVDISGLLAAPAPAPNGNFGPQLINIIEQYLLTQPTFSGGTQVT